MKITKSHLRQIIKEELNEMRPLAIRMGLKCQREKAPFHDLFDDHVPYARELAQKMWDDGERLPDTSQTSQLSAKQEASLIDTIYKESGDLTVSKDALSDLVMDVTEELWAIQEKSEDV